MSCLDTGSLAGTVESLDAAMLAGRPIAAAEKNRIARWIASRQGLPRSYFGLVAPTDTDFAAPARLFTGETLTTRAATAHILGEEACRMLIVLDVDEPAVQSALQRTTANMLGRLSGPQVHGWYCCGKCSCSLWRHLAAGGLDLQEQRLAAGVQRTKDLRHAGRWRSLPFFYALQTLTEIDLPAAREELKYAAEACERILKRGRADDVYASRRRQIAERALACA